MKRARQEPEKYDPAKDVSRDPRPFTPYRVEPVEIPDWMNGSYPDEPTDEAEILAATDDESEDEDE